MNTTATKDDPYVITPAMIEVAQGWFNGEICFCDRQEMALKMLREVFEARKKELDEANRGHILPT